MLNALATPCQTAKQTPFHIFQFLSIFQNKGKFLCSAVSSPQDRPKCFTSLADLFNQTPSRLFCETSSHAAINARRLFVAITTMYSFIQLSELEQCKEEKLAQSFNTAAQGSNPGSLSRESEALPLSHRALQKGLDMTTPFRRCLYRSLEKKLCNSSILFIQSAYLLYACIGHRPRNATVFCQWPSSPFLSWCLASPLFLFPYLFARCFVAYLFSSSLGGPCDGLMGDGFWWFPECMSYPPPFSLLYFIFYG